MWKLKEVLAASGAPPMTAYTTNDANPYALVTKTLPITPCPIGKSQSLRLDAHAGLPNWLSIDERKCLRLAIVNALRTNTITWQEPVSTFTQMKLSFEDLQLPFNSAHKISNVTLRARPIFQGKPAFDNVKVEVEEEGGRIRRYFAKCLAFFCDAQKDMFVGLRWYEPADKNDKNNLIDPIVRLAAIKLAPKSNTRSYGIMPVKSIVNGALIIRMDEQHWAFQSPREQAEYLHNV